MALGISQVLERIGRVASAAEGNLSKRECVRSFLAFTGRLESVLEQLKGLYDEQELLPAALLTALDGIEKDFSKAEDALSLYRLRSQFFVLTHCYALNKTMEGLTQSLGKWISLIALPGISDNRELNRKIGELSSEMQHVRFQVTEAEERSLDALELKRERSDTVLAGNLWRDIARLIGVEARMNSTALQEQVELLKKEVKDLQKDAELQKMQNILRLFEHVTDEPQLTRMYSFKETIEEEPLPPFDSFICPLTRQIMKRPVLIQSELTYERDAIEKWFRTCSEERRAATCPVTGSVLTSTELKSNVMLRQTIIEWFHRNARIRIQQALTLLLKTTSLEEIEEALDSILKVCEEDGLLTQFKLGKSRFVPSVLNLWKRKMPEGSQVRTKALIILQRIAADDLESQEALIEAGVLKPVVRALSSSQVNEIESALKLLLVISRKPEHAKVIGNEKGAIIHLLAIASNSSGNASASSLAEKTLRNLEQVDLNVWEMAEAGRLEPLLARLCHGSEQTRIEMAKFLAKRIFVSSQQEFVTKKAGKVIVEMLSGSLEAKEASLGALTKLSRLDDNVPVLVKAGVLFPIVEIIFSVLTSSDSLRGGTLKEGAATILANIVSAPGSWETVKIDVEGNTMQSENFVHTILALLSSVGPDWNSKLLKILIGIASSPQAADSVVKHVISGNGIKFLLALLRENGDERLNCLNLLSVLSSKAGTEVSRALVQVNYLEQLRNILKQKVNSEEIIAAAAILSNIPLTETELVNVLGLDMINWCLCMMEELRLRHFGSARLTYELLEGVLGVLLQFCRSRNKDVLETMKQNKLMMRFKEALQLHHGQAVVKQRAAAGLAYLSERGLQEASGTAASKQELRWSAFLCSFARPSISALDLCPLHSSRCKGGKSFCLREADAVRPLVELLDDEEELAVQLAAVDALSTLVYDQELLEAGVRELAGAQGIGVILRWFQRLRSSNSSEALEKGTYLVERILRVEEHANRSSLDQGLIKALVEVFKHGSPAARRTAEAALARTQMLSVVSGSATASGRA